MADLKGSCTAQCLKDAFAWDPGQPPLPVLCQQGRGRRPAQVAALLRSTAEVKPAMPRPHGNFWKNQRPRDPGCPSAPSARCWPRWWPAKPWNAPRCTPHGPDCPRGFHDVADWFETLHQGRAQPRQPLHQALASFTGESPAGVGPYAASSITTSIFAACGVG